MTFVLRGLHNGSLGIVGQRPSRAAFGTALRSPGLVVLATAVTLAANWPLVHAVLAGTFTDPDDAMRLVEVRAWMAGQSWFDVTALRLDPPVGASMHWSRLVDLPNALLIRLFGLFTPHAEAWDRIVLPTLLLAALYAGVARLAGVLLDRPARAVLGPALLGAFLTGVTLAQVQPGRIGHHGPETVALVWAVASALASLGGRAREAALAGVLAALCLAMSLETLPFVGALCAGMALAWVLRGAEAAPTLRAFALGLGCALPVLFAATVDPRSWFAPVCDAIGAAHLGSGLIFAVSSLLLAAGSRKLDTLGHRAAAAGAVAAVTLAYVALAFPSCLHSPFAGVDPLVREVWLDHVVESLPLSVFARGRPWLALAIIAPMVLGVAGCLWAALAARGGSSGWAATRFALIAALGGWGLAVGFWQVRVFASVAPFALCGGLYAVAELQRRLAGSGRAAAIAAILPFTSIGWAVALPDDSGGMPAGERPCLAASAFPPLAALPPGRVVAPVDAGSHLLVATGHRVFAAPYHRNNDGNRFAIDVFGGAPDEARRLLASRRVDYLMTCPSLGETARLAARAPGSLAALLQADAVPAFLHPLKLAGTPYRVYAVAPSD